MNFVPGQTVGIDLGTSYSSIATLASDGTPTVIENAEGRPVTPSIILLATGGKVLVGPNPQRVADSQAETVVIAIKRQMGNPSFSIMHENRKLTPELLSSMILTKLKQDAEKQIGPIGNAVITVPYYFNDPMRQATRHAGKIAGLNVIDIINEPTAATLAYAWGRNELGLHDGQSQERTVLVYDLGGGTFDVTLVRYTGTDFNVLCTDGDTMLGGLDWTERIADFVAGEFFTQHGFDPREDEHIRRLLMLESEAAKRELTLFPKTTIQFSANGSEVEVELDRAGFESLTGDLLQRTQDTTEFVLDQGKLKAAQLDEVVLVGGSSTMPMVAAMLEKLLKKKPSKQINPHVAVAQGAAIHAAILQAKCSEDGGEVAHGLMSRLKSITTTDVNSHSLGVEITDRNNPGNKLNHIMIPRNSQLPAKCRQRFVTTTNHPRSIHVKLLQGETEDLSGCTYIGEFRLSQLPEVLPAGSPIQLTYSYDEQGMIRVKLKELTGDNMTVVEIDWSHGLDDQSINGLTDLAGEYKIS